MAYSYLIFMNNNYTKFICILVSFICFVPFQFVNSDAELSQNVDFNDSSDNLRLRYFEHWNNKIMEHYKSERITFDIFSELNKTLESLKASYSAIDIRSLSISIEAKMEYYIFLSNINIKSGYLGVDQIITSADIENLEILMQKVWASGRSEDYDAFNYYRMQMKWNLLSQARPFNCSNITDSIEDSTDDEINVFCDSDYNSDNVSLANFDHMSNKEDNYINTQLLTDSDSNSSKIESYNKSFFGMIKDKVVSFFNKLCSFFS